LHPYKKFKTETAMGRGDKRTRKGKISQGSYGVTRPHKTKVDSTATKKKNVVAAKK
jgi:30S ribosomal protein S31